MRLCYSTLQRHNTENSNQIFPEKELIGLAHNKHKNVEIWTEAAQFPFWEHKNGIFVAMYSVRKRLLDETANITGG